MKCGTDRRRLWDGLPSRPTFLEWWDHPHPIYLGLSIDPQAPPDLSCLDKLRPSSFVIVKRLIGVSFADL